MLRRHHTPTASHRHTLILGALLLAMLAATLAGCTGSSPQARLSATATPTATALSGNVFTDPFLGYRLTLPPGWHATASPGQGQPPMNDVTTLTEPTPADSTITIGVFHGPRVAGSFADRGTPTLRIGSYPAFNADTGLSQGRVPCVVRIMLASADYVLAEWCAMDAMNHAKTFEQFLATYIPEPANFTTSAIIERPTTPSCGTIMAAYGYSTASWGRTLATPTTSAPDGGWSGMAGTYVCSNTNSPDRYLFQCTELINRYDAEQRGLAHIPGSAARYFDYYLGGVLHPGNIRDFPEGSFALSDDASQGTSAFAPQPGDLLIFQDVTNTSQGWTSGLILSPGHIALITAVDATDVYIAQENYSDRQYFLALPMEHTARGYRITDRSGVYGRIVRGWIRLNLTSA